ncbi:hypothetical protein GCM10023149_33840 [Mucilaginibacter gynuensis]|uniref:Uncharacterized protein n=1 Tax=Mucilaginibacter gynuensis TaxID=1302236 RepID=A0ABP8GSB6_9SPHI
MMNNRLVMTMLTIAMVVIISTWQLTEHGSPELLKQVLGVITVCWLVYILFRMPQDDDDWAGQC